MIRKQDILDRAAEWQLRPEVVEKDYVLGWILAALAQHPETAAGWVFKGGTCLKKCYFETYRFSEDLDFTLLPGRIYTSEALLKVLREVAGSASELSGVTFPEEQVIVKERRDKLGRETFEGRIGYRGPLAFPSWPRILFDLTQHEPVVDAPVARVVFHPYPDDLPAETTIQAYSLTELFAEKTRALMERTRPRDLYDTVFMLENHGGVLRFAEVQRVLAQKCAAKGLAVPTPESMLEIIRGAPELRTEWENMLAHQLPALPPMEGMLERLPVLLRWLGEPDLPPATGLVAAPAGAGEVLVAPPGVTFWGRGVGLEAIRFAGANRLMIEFTYKERRRRVEPYSLRRSSVGNLLLYAWEIGETHIKAFNTALLTGLRVTTEFFTPRYRVEFAPGGPMAAPHRREVSPGHGARTVVGSSGRRGPRRTGVGGPTYVFKCSFCQKEFRHRSNDPTLRKHKSSSGLTCSGRRGNLVRVT